MKYLLFVLLLISCYPTIAQAPLPQTFPDGKVVIKKQDATFTFIPYARNIIKVILQPAGYKTNELVSDAVMTKPEKSWVKVTDPPGSDYKVTWGAMTLLAKNDTLFFGSSQNGVLMSVMHNGEYNGFRFLLTGNERIFGGGERALPLNRRGYKFNLYNNPWYGYGVGADNLNYSVPFITSSNNYALFFDNPSKGYLDIGKTDNNILEYGACSGQLNFYLVKGSSYADILAAYHSLTGTQPIPPRWVLGNFLSRFGYMSQNEVLNIAQKMKDEHIPYDAVILDLFWFGDSIKGTLGNLEWVNKRAWPAPAKMISQLKKEGTQTVLITEPFVVQSTLNYNAAKQYCSVDSTGKPFVIKDFYFGHAGLIDIFRKDSRDWFWTKYKAQMLKGVEGWWGDLGEPERHPADLYHNLKDFGFGRLFRADEVHNMYGHYWTKMLFDKYALEYPNKRLFSLNRSGFAGTQRYCIFPWTGDVGRNWSGLQAQVPIFLGMSMSGIPYIHSDAGGFAGGSKDSELYIRWLQFAAYTPVFKPHGTELSLIDTTTGNFPSEPALFDEPYRSLARQVVLNRYALLPYNYTLAYNQQTAGKPLIAPLYYYYPSDSGAYTAEDEFMWGESMLVAPVLKKGEDTRKMYLPAGAWYNYATAKKRTGGTWFNESVTMDAIPVFIKEGSFIPKNNKVVNNTSAYNTADITVTYYPSDKFSEYTLFDDDGSTNKSVQKNQFELITFETEGWAEKTTFTIKSNRGMFKGKPAKRNITFTIPSLWRVPASVKINGKPLGEKTATTASYTEWNSETKTVNIHFTFTGDPVVIAIEE